MNNLTSAITRSREAYHQALEQCEENIEKWKGHEKEYRELRDRLDQFPKKLSHDVMVPFGKVALMPGHLVHTNEVLVLLGDNWFAMRSAHQAKGIVDRRLKYVTDMITKYEEEKKLYLDRLEATGRLLQENNGGDYFEIREPISDAADQPKKARIAHQPATSKKSTSAVKKAVSTADPETSTKKVTDEEFSNLMNRLDQLHYQERLGDDTFGEASKTSEENGATSAEQNKTTRDNARKVVWKDEAESSSFEIASSDQANSETEILSMSNCDRPAKSILKNRDEHTPVGELPPSPYEQRPKVISSASDEAFSGKILERIPTDSAATVPTSEPPRRVSKFAQERAALKKQ